MRKILVVIIAGLSALIAERAMAAEVQYDTSGKGAVLCAELMLMEVRYMSQLCQWDRTPADDAIDQAITDIDAFVIANSSKPVTQEQLDKQKADYFSHRPSPGGAPPLRCVADPAKLDSDTRFLWDLHSQEAVKLSAWIADLLSVPREPLLNPCL